MSTSPAFAYACRAYSSYIPHEEHLYRTVNSHHPHPDMSLVGWNVPNLGNCQNKQKHGPSGNYQLPPAERCVSVKASKRDSTQRGRSVASTIHGHNSTPSSLRNTFCITGITHSLPPNPSTTQWLSIITPTSTPGKRSCSPQAPGGTLETDSTSDYVSSTASSIDSTPTPLSGLENLPTTMSNAEVRAIITNPLRIQASKTNQR